MSCNHIFFVLTMFSIHISSNGNQGGHGFFRFGSQRPNGRRHHSSMSNGSEGFGDFDGFEENGVPDMRHIKHNHTYTVPPGEAPKERKSDIKKVRPPLPHTHTKKKPAVYFKIENELMSWVILNTT